jgi:hypothetical protein
VKKKKRGMGSHKRGANELNVVKNRGKGGAHNENAKAPLCYFLFSSFFSFSSLPRKEPKESRPLLFHFPFQVRVHDVLLGNVEEHWFGRDWIK